MPKIIGKIVGVQGARNGVTQHGTEWYSRQYVIEDETHLNEGVIVNTVNVNVMQQIGHQTHGELVVEVDYVPKLRYWDGTTRDGQKKEPQWFQTNDLTGFRILKGNAANKEQITQQPAVAVVPAQPAQPAQSAQPVQAPQPPQPNDLPF